MTTLAVVAFMLVAVVLMLASGQTAPVEVGCAAIVLGLCAFFLFSGSQTSKTEKQIEIAPGSVEQFHIDCGRYPTTEEGLAVVATNPPSCEGFEGGSEPKDPCGNAFAYSFHETNGRSAYEIQSRGRDPDDDEDDISVTGFHEEALKR